MEESDNLVNHHDDYGIINDGAGVNGMEDDEDFDGFHDNEGVTNEAEEASMDVLIKITGSGNNVYQFLMR